MKLTVIKKRVSFSAAHRLFSDGMSEEENERIYGKCASPHYHGHNYVVEVAVEGPIDSRTGMVVNFSELKRIMDEEIVSKLDHTNLNVDVDFLKDIVPTAENIACAIWKILEKRLNGVNLRSVEVWENQDSSALYEGKE